MMIATPRFRHAPGADARLSRAWLPLVLLALAFTPSWAKDDEPPPPPAYDIPFSYCITSPANGIPVAVGQSVRFSHEWSRISIWDFNDGSRSSSPDTTHSFASPRDYRVTLTCPSYMTRKDGDSVRGGTCTVLIHVLPPPAIASFSASPAAVYRGEQTQLRIGDVTGYGKLALSIDQGVGPVAAYCPVIRVDKTTTFTLTASSPYGTTTATCTVTVKPAPEITQLTASPASINRGDAVTLSWGTTGDGVSLSLDHGIGLVQGRRLTVLPDRTTTYTLTATNPSGEVSSTSATILVNQPPVPGPITLPALPAGQALRTVLPQAQDPEHDAIRAYSTLGLPAGLAFDPASRTLSGSVATPGAYRFLYCAKDARGALGSAWVNLVIRAVGASPGAGGPLKVSYAYDGQGRLATLTYPSGRAVAYGYDALDRVTRISQNGQTVIQDIAYDAWGNRSRLLSRSGTMDQWTCDASGSRVQAWDLGLVGSTPQVRTYAYDGAGRLTRAGEWDTLAYDPNGRLLRAAGFGLADALAHDAYGNNTSSVTTSPGQVPVAFNNFTFDPLADNHLPGRSANGGLTRIDEDNFGELTHLGTGISSEGALALAWDDLGCLASAGHEAYRYAASGLRAARTDSQDARQNRIYAYTTAGQLLSEYTADPGPTWARDIIYLGSLAVAEIDAGGTHELHSDHLGTPRVITGTTGIPEGTQAFGPYGELIQQTGYVPLTGYTGHLQTEPTGLIYMRGRFYSPAWHRFMNSDQGVDPNLINQFAYTIGNPLMDTDPTGMDNCPNTDGRSPESRAAGGVGRNGDMSGRSGGDPGHSSVKDGLDAARDVVASHIREVELLPQVKPLPPEEIPALIGLNISKFKNYLPGYVNLGLSFKELGNVTVNFALARDGAVYGSLQIGGGVSATGFNGSLTAGYLDGASNLSGKAIHDLLSGLCGNVTIGAYGGVAATGNGKQMGKEVGVMSPQASFGFNYGLRLGKLPGVQW